MLPKYKEIQDPLLAELARRGGSSRPSAKDALGRSVYEALADHFDLPADARNEVIYESNGTPRSKWENMVRWARNDLKKAGLLNSPQHGVWAVSSSGAKRLHEYDSERAGHGVVREGVELDPAAFEAQLQRAKEVGDAGEIFVLQYERDRLANAGKAHLATRVRHIAAENVAAGYDVLSFDKDESERYIEVKSTTGAGMSFEITRNEFDAARRHRSSYWLYRVISVLDSPSIHAIRDPWGLVQDNKLLVRASSYTMSLADDYED